MCNVRSAIGLIQEGDLVIKDWVDPPLHLICSKRVWATSITDILQSKKEYKELGTTADKEASQPSADVPPDLVGF